MRKCLRCHQEIHFDYEDCVLGREIEGNGTEAHVSNDLLTERQKDGLRRVLTRIGSWTSARWDQHLRNEIGDEDADRVIAAMRLLLDSESGEHWPDCATNHVPGAFCDMGPDCGKDKTRP